MVRLKMMVQDGKLYEEKVKKLLTLKGFKIIGENFRSRWGEIDLIALKGKNLFVIEVKGGKDLKELYGRIDCKKIQRLVKTFYHFLLRNPDYENFEPVLVGVFIDDKGKLDFVPLRVDDCFENLY